MNIMYSKTTWILVVAAALIAACGGDDVTPAGDVGEASDAGVVVDSGATDEDAAADAGPGAVTGDDAGDDAGPGIDCTEDAGVLARGGLGSSWVPREEIDAARASMPPVAYDPPQDRWEFLPKTEAALCAKTGLDVVMLGDSIMNNTRKSRWDEFLVAEIGGTISITTVLRGSTGPEFYSMGTGPYCYAARFAPDLLILGGISQLTIESIRTLVTGARSYSPGTEVLLMTKAFGSLIPGGYNWAYAPEDDPAPYRVELRALADELGAGFLDVTAQWGQYILDSGEPLENWKADKVHGNTRGEQILGQILEAHLNPHLGGDACGAAQP